MKYVIRFSPDYNATSLWPDNELAMATFNMPIIYNEVGLSDAVIAELKRFDNSIMGIIDWDNPGGASPLSRDERMEIYNEGKRLYQLVKKELDDGFEVIECLEWLNPDGE